jgi:hypothetical protein
MLRRLSLLLAVFFLLPASAALAGGGNYILDGGTPRERAEVKAALAASSFDWGLLPQQVTVHIGKVGVSHANPGHVWLDGSLLNAGRFSWATVMDEFAHQVDFLLLDPARRATLQAQLRTSAWCYETEDQSHSGQGCERFSSMLAWAYWPSKDNAYAPTSQNDESATMNPAAFRQLLGDLIGAPTLKLKITR